MRKKKFTATIQTPRSSNPIKDNAKWRNKMVAQEMSFLLGEVERIIFCVQHKNDLYTLDPLLKVLFSTRGNPVQPTISLPLCVVCVCVSRP